MKSLILIIALLLPAFAHAGETVYQCAVDKVDPDGARVNIIVSNFNQLKANLIFGTTVSGTMYNVEVGYTAFNQAIYTGVRKGDDVARIVITLEIRTELENSNVRGRQAHLFAVYPDLNSSTGYSTIDTDIICGEKISDRWQ